MPFLDNMSIQRHYEQCLCSFTVKKNVCVGLTRSMLLLSFLLALVTQRELSTLLLCVVALPVQRAFLVYDGLQDT